MTYHDATIKYGRIGVHIRQIVNEEKRLAVIRYQRARVNCKCSICKEWLQTPIGKIARNEVKR